MVLSRTVFPYFREYGPVSVAYQSLEPCILIAS